MTQSKGYNGQPERFSRAWWLRHGRNFLWVCVVTVLVWTYADVEFTDEMQLRTTIFLTTAHGSNLVLRGENRVEVSFKARGRRSSLERLDRRLRTLGTVVRHEVSEGQTEVSATEILNRYPQIHDEGLSVLLASPGVLRVRLDRKIYIPDVPVKPDYGGGMITEEEIIPPKVGLHVARSEWQEILKAQPNPVLTTVRVDPKLIQPNKPFQARLVRVLGGFPVEPDRQTVTVRARFVQLTETEQLAVNVQVISPLSWMEDGTWGLYSLKRREPTQWRVRIEVRGTRKDLDQLKAEDVLAYIVLTEEDRKPVSWLPRDVQIRLPQNLNLTLVSAQPTVDFKLEKAAGASQP